MRHTTSDTRKRQLIAPIRNQALSQQALPAWFAARHARTSALPLEGRQVMKVAGSKHAKPPIATNAGIQRLWCQRHWIPTFAGTTCTLYLLFRRECLNNLTQLLQRFLIRGAYIFCAFAARISMLQRGEHGMRHWNRIATVVSLANEIEFWLRFHVASKTV